MIVLDIAVFFSLSLAVDMKPDTIQKVQTHNLPITYQMCKAQVMQLARLAMRHSIATLIRTVELRLSQWKGQIGMPHT